jgi:hypothetical protein
MPKPLKRKLGDLLPTKAPPMPKVMEPRKAMHFEVRTNSASECLCAFLDGLRATGTVFKGSNAQLIGLMVDALDCVSPNTDAASQDADTLARDFEAIVEVLADGDDDVATYDKDEEDE